MPPPYYFPSGATAEQSLYAVAASNYVQDLAPMPDDEPDDYIERAEAAEFLVYRFLASTQAGAVTSESARGVSRSYATVEAVSTLIAAVMGEYFEGSTVTATNTGYVGDFS